MAGTFWLQTVHTHSNDDPEFTGLLFDTERLPFDFGEGDEFTYSSSG